MLVYISPAANWRWIDRRSRRRSIQIIFPACQFIIPLIILFSATMYKFHRIKYSLSWLLFLLMIALPIMGQKATFREPVELAAKITQSLPPIFITNNTDATIEVNSISFKIERYPGLEWRIHRQGESVSAQTYQRPGEGWTIKNVRIGKAIKYTGIYRIRKRLNIGDERDIDVNKNIKLEDSILSVYISKTSLAPDEVIKINKLPISVGDEIADGKININIQINGQGKYFSVTQDLTSFTPVSQFSNIQSDHLSYIDSREKPHTKLTIKIKEPLQLSCLSTRNLLQEDQRIGIRILGNRKLSWGGNIRPVLREPGGDKIQIYNFDVDGNYLEFSLSSSVKAKSIQITQLQLTYKDSSMLIGSFPLQFELNGSSRNIIPIQQSIHFGAPEFSPLKEELDLLPYQSNILLPEITIREHPKAAGINKNRDIILKIYPEHTVDRKSKTSGAFGHLKQVLSTPTRTTNKVIRQDLVHWVSNLQGLEYSGSAQKKMGFLTGSDQRGGLLLTLPVEEDFSPGDSLTIRGLAVKTKSPDNDLEFSILASFDGGQTFSRPNGDEYRLNKKMGILAPALGLQDARNIKYLYQDRRKPFPDIVLVNQGVRPLFKAGDVLIIKYENDLLTSWRDKNADSDSNQPTLKLNGARSDRVGILSDSELRIETESPLLPGEALTIGNLSMGSFNKRGRSQMILVQSNRLTSPIAKTTETIEVTSPTIESMVEQLLMPATKISEFSGIQISSYEDLDFEKYGLRLKLPKNMGLKWGGNNSTNIKLFMNGKIVDKQVAQFDDYILSIKPTQKISGPLFIHDLLVESTPNNVASQDTGRLSFSFNGGYSYSDRDSRLIRRSEAGDRYSEEIKKYQLISSNFNPVDELVFFLTTDNTISDYAGRTRNSARFDLIEPSFLRLSPRYDDRIQIEQRQLINNEFHIKPDRSIHQPSTFFEINGLSVEGDTEILKSTRLGVSIHNYSGYDTLIFDEPLLRMGSQDSMETEIDPLLPKMFIWTHNKEQPSLTTITIDRLKIRNAILGPTSQSLIGALSESNIKNVKTYIAQQEYSNAQREINSILRYSGHYWLGFWLNHNLYAEQQKIREAQSAIDQAERYGWISTSVEYPKHENLGGSAVERARNRYAKSIDYYNQNKIWEADSILTSLRQTYLDPQLLDDEIGGQELKNQIWELCARVSEEFSDYVTASKYYDKAAYSATNWKMLERLAKNAKMKADSLGKPYTGVLEEIRIDPGIIQMLEVSVNSEKSIVSFTGVGFENYPLELSNQKYSIGEEILIQGGLNYQLSPNLVIDESKRMGVALVLSTALFGMIVFNQGL